MWSRQKRRNRDRHEYKRATSFFFGVPLPPPRIDHVLRRSQLFPHDIPALIASPPEYIDLIEGHSTPVEKLNKGINNLKSFPSARSLRNLPWKTSRRTGDKWNYV